MQSEILSWLKNPQDYFSGLQLLEQSCKNEFLLRMLRKGPTAFNRETLQEELQRIADKASKPKIQSTGQFQIRSAEHFNSLPQQVKDLQDEKDRIYKEMSFLHSQLELYKTDEQRQEPALRILDLDDQVRSIWEKLDYYEANGKLPDEPVAPSIEAKSPAELMQRRNNLRSYISRTPQGAGNDDKIKAWQTELDEIEKKL